MKTVLAKYSMQDLIKSGYQGPVMVSVLDDLEGVPYGVEHAVTMSKGAKAVRTTKQNSAIHKYFTLLSYALNAAGMDMIAAMRILSKKGRIPWSAHAVKERLWRPVQIDTYGKESTTELNTDEVSAVYEALNVVTGDKLGVSIPFPDKYNDFYAQMGRK